MDWQENLIPDGDPKEKRHHTAEKFNLRFHETWQRHGTEKEESLPIYNICTHFCQSKTKKKARPITFYLELNKRRNRETVTRDMEKGEKYKEREIARTASEDDPFKHIMGLIIITESHFPTFCGPWGITL